MLILGGGDGVGGLVDIGGCAGGFGPVELVAYVGEVPADYWRVFEAAPTAGGPFEYGPHEAETGCFTGHSSNDLDSSSGLAEGPFDQVRVPDPFMVLCREP